MGFGSLVLGALPWAVVVGCSTQRLFHTQARDRLTHGLSRDGVRWSCSSAAGGRGLVKVGAHGLGGDWLAWAGRLAAQAPTALGLGLRDWLLACWPAGRLAGWLKGLGALFEGTKA